MQNFVSRVCWLFDMAEGAFLTIKKSREPGNEAAKYKEIDGAHINGIAE